MMKQDTKIIGLVGKTCSGKSYISDYLKEFFRLLNPIIIDVDQIGKDILNPKYKDGNFLNKIFNAFSEFSIKNQDNSLNRGALAQVVFSNKDNLKRLNSICFPEICEIVKMKIEELKSIHRLIIVDCAVLFESNLYKLVDKTVYVDVDYEIQLNRVINRFKVTKEEAEVRIKGQNFSKYLHLADYSIENNDLSNDELKVKFKTLF